MLLKHNINSTSPERLPWRCLFMKRLIILAITMMLSAGAFSQTQVGASLQNIPGCIADSGSYCGNSLCLVCEGEKVTDLGFLDKITKEDKATVYRITINDTKITSTPSNAFTGFTEVVTLEITNNKDLKEIKPDIFNGLNNLVCVFLTDNQLTQIDLTDMLQLKNLKSIHIVGNPLKKIEYSKKMPEDKEKELWVSTDISDNIVQGISKKITLRYRPF